jgi:hypothetical protein
MVTTLLHGVRSEEVQFIAGWQVFDLKPLNPSTLKRLMTGLGGKRDLNSIAKPPVSQKRVKQGRSVHFFTAWEKMQRRR